MPDPIIRPSSCAHQLRHLAVIVGDIALPPEKLAATLTQIADLVEEEEAQALLCKQLLQAVRQIVGMAEVVLPAPGALAA